LVTDALGNKIFVTGTVTFVVKGDSTKEAFTLPNAIVLYFDDAGTWERFEIYNDASQVMARVAEVMKAKA
jgi:hypothetical protein